MFLGVCGIESRHASSSAKLTFDLVMSLCIFFFAKSATITIAPSPR